MKGNEENQSNQTGGILSRWKRIKEDQIKLDWFPKSANQIDINQSECYRKINRALLLNLHFDSIKIIIVIYFVFFNIRNFIVVTLI